MVDNPTPTPSPVPDIVTGIIRAVLASGGGLLVNNGLATAQQASTLEGAGLILIVGLWSVWANYQQHQKLKAAIAAPTGKAS